MRIDGLSNILYACGIIELENGGRELKRLALGLLIGLGWMTTVSAEEIIVEREIGKPIPGEEILYDGVDRVIVAIPIPETPSGESFEKQIEVRDGVIDVSENADIERQGTISRHQPYITNMGFSFVWPTYRGEGITVAILDEGMDVTHPEFKGKIVAPYDSTRQLPFITDKGIHGTHVAGIIGATFDDRGVVGVAPAVNLMPIDIFEGENAKISDAIRGISHAVKNGAKVINMSFGTYDRNSALEAALQDARSKGVTLVAAAGNDDIDAPFYPAAYKDVLAVGAVTMDNGIADFTNYGSFIDVVAPGENIYSSLPNGRYGFMSGTSMSTPIVSGLAALLLSKEPNLSPGMVYARLKSTAIDLGDPGKDLLFGYGAVSITAMDFEEVDYDTLRDINPPKRPYLDLLTNQSKMISGRAEMGSTVHIHYRGKMYTRVATNGKYSKDVNRLKVGSTVTIVARDRAFNQSLPITRTVYGKFEEPSFHPFYSDSSRVRGKGKKYATVQAFVGGKAVSRVVKINSKGEFSIPIRPQRRGTVVQVKMKSPYYISQTYELVVIK